MHRDQLFLVGTFLINFAEEECGDLDAILDGPFSLTYGATKDQCSLTLSSSAPQPAERWRRIAWNAYRSAEMFDEIVEKYKIYRARTPEDDNWVDKMLQQIEQKDFMGAYAAFETNRLELLESLPKKPGK